MGRYEVRFYDALNRVKVTLELDALTPDAADFAARLYLADEAPMRLLTHHLVLGAVRQLAGDR